MELIQLTNDNKEVLNGKNIVLYEKSMDYIYEFIGLYNELFSNILFIVDDYRRNQGIIHINNRDVCIKDSNALLDIAWENTILVILSDYYEEAYEKINKQLNNKLINIYYFLSNESSVEIEYREKYEDIPLDDLIIFRSGPHSSAYVHGTDFSDNARALFEYMLRIHLNMKYRLVWLVKDPSEFEYKYLCHDNVQFISFDGGKSDEINVREEYFKILFTAKYIFMTDAYGFARNCRKEQIRVQLWHGCGYKTRTNFVPCEKRYDYTIVISDLYKKIHREIYGLRDDQIFVTGYPKEDWLFEPTADNILERLHIINFDKLIVWLPTFRKAKACLSNLDESDKVSETELPILDTYKKMIELNRILNKHNTVLAIKLHPFQKKSHFDATRLSNIVLIDNETLCSEDIQVNELLSKADALISDYSSGAVDFLMLDRPMAFTLDDVSEYSDSRGFVFDNILEWLPGKEIWCEQDFIDFVEEITNNMDELIIKRDSIRRKMHDFSDGNSCRRVLEALGIS